MVRLALVLALAATLCVAAPASANPLTQGVAATVTGTVQQATTTVDAVVPDTSAALPGPAGTAVQTVVETTSTAAKPATESVTKAAASVPVAVPAPAPAATETSSSPRASTPPTHALSSSRDRGPARELRVGRDRAEAEAHHQARPVQMPASASLAADGVAVTATASADGPQAPAAGPDREDRHAPSFVPASGSASAASSFFFAGAALLAGLFCLTGPRLVRRLPTAPVEYRPVAFASSLERPG
jgi:hypothetical protein